MCMYMQLLLHGGREGDLINSILLIIYSILQVCILFIFFCYCSVKQCTVNIDSTCLASQYNCCTLFTVNTTHLLTKQFEHDSVYKSKIRFITLVSVQSETLHLTEVLYLSFKLVKMHPWCTSALVLYGIQGSEQVVFGHFCSQNVPLCNTHY